MRKTYLSIGFKYFSKCMTKILKPNCAIWQASIHAHIELQILFYFIFADFLMKYVRWIFIVELFNSSFYIS